MMMVMTERSDDGEREIWGTREDLLLAFAVLRHGAEDWDTVAMELRRRTRTSPARVTSQDCKNRYHGLRRRFQGVVQREIEEVGASAAPWMEELRQLRVAELRREVQRIDVSIGSLESKLKTLTEEGQAAGNGRADADDSRNGEKMKICDESPASPSVDAAGDHASGNSSGRWSCDESTSPRRDPTPVNGGGGRVEVPVDQPGMKPGPGSEKGPAEGSCNGSSDTMVKVRNTAEEEAAKPPCAPPESGESRQAARENSDVQSSASLSKKRWGRRSKAAVSGGSSGGDEADVVSPSASERREEGENKSRPLAAFLEMIRMNKHGSLFQRRLQIQESTRYRSMIRQHIDLGTIGSRLDGSLPYTAAEFFRDLLLLCNNAIVFFPEASSQHVAAARLRDLVNKEMEATDARAGHNDKPNASEFPMAPPPSQPARMKSESDAEKQSTTPTLLLACRRRNSYLSPKAATVAAAEEAVAGEKEVDEELENAENKKRELPVARGLRTTKARAAVSKKNGVGVGVEVSNPKPNPVDEQSNSKTKERNNNSGGNNVKKRSAATFLDRLKKGGLSTPKNEQKKGKGGRGEGKKDPGGARLVSSTRKAPENPTPVKRSVGRPPKRPSAKRARATGRDVSPPPRPSRGSGTGRKKPKR